MQLKTYSFGKELIYPSIEQYAYENLADPNLESGVIESLTKRAQNNSIAIGRLLEVLVARGLLNACEIVNIINGDNGTIAEFEC